MPAAQAGHGDSPASRSDTDVPRRNEVGKTFWTVGSLVPGRHFVSLADSEREGHIPLGPLVVAVHFLKLRELEQLLYSLRGDVLGALLAEMSSAHAASESG